MTEINVRLTPAEQIQAKLKPAQSIKVKTSNVYVLDPSMADKFLVFEQGIAADVWEIQHNLNKRPSVSVVDSAENVITAEVEYIDNNNVVVRMNGATTGKAYLN